MRSFTGENKFWDKSGVLMQIDEYIHGERVRTTFMVAGVRYLVLNYIDGQVIGDANVYNLLTGKIEKQYTEEKGKVAI